MTKLKLDQMLATIATVLLASQARQPNIIQIVADDVGWDDLGCYGARDVRTPNIDRLAKEGVRFTNYYAPAPTCTPTRAALMTGCYAQRVSQTAVLFPDAKIGLHPEETTLAESLKDAGYRTALIGKWHNGSLPKFLPPSQGFDEYLGIPYPNDHVPERLTFKEPRVTRGFPPMPLIRGLEVIQQPAQLATLPEMFAKEAVQFIEKNRSKPFFLHYSNIETHTPWLMTRPFQYKSKRGVYGDAIQCLDWQVGQIMDAVRRLGLENDTVVVFSSDNGPLISKDPELEGIYGHAATVDVDRKRRLRGGKYQAKYEGGTRVAGIAWSPSRIAKGKVSNALVAGIDWFPSFIGYAGATLPRRKIDGKDIRTLLKEGSGPDVHDAVFLYEANRLAAVRSGKWKLVFNKEAELYDLQKDLGETKNLASIYPDVVKELDAKCDPTRRALGDQLRGIQGTEVRPAGS